MKLRSLKLHNVRRFADQTAQIGPFGDGLTTITAENEQGKSTFFDALHVLLFSAHNSQSQEVKSLQPHSGGPVQITAEIDVEGHAYRIEKTYLQQRSAQVIDVTSGAILQQAGDAEAWIEAHILRANKGPTGLLWVRQGMSHVDPTGRDKDAGNLAARRDLMSSVQGQIDTVTGGRRMDRIVGRARAELETLATKTLRPKAGGPWKDAEDTAETLEVTRDQLQQQVRKLSNALAQKRTAKARLSALNDPEHTQRRTLKIAAASKALEAARGHLKKLNEAATTLDLISREAALVAQSLSDLEVTRTRRAALMIDKKAQQDAHAKAVQAEAEATNALSTQKAKLSAARAARQELEAVRQAAHATQITAQKWDRLRGLARSRDALSAPRTALQNAQTALSTTPDVTPADIDALDALRITLTVAEERHSATAARVILHPEGDAKATHNSIPVSPHTEVAIDADMTLNLQGYGALRLVPGTATDSAKLDTLRTQMTEKLGMLAVADIAAARTALSTRQQAKADAATARAQIAALAPDGTEALEAMWRALCVDLGHDPDAAMPEPQGGAPAAQPDLDYTAHRLEAEIEAARAPLDALQQAVTQAITARATATGALDRLATEQKALAPAPDEDSLRAGLDTKRSALAQQQAAAEAEVTTLRAAIPDVDALEAAHQRLSSAQAADETERRALELQLAGLTAEIAVQADASVEEKLAETEGQLAQARARAARYAQEARAWALLIQELEDARQAAQETYFAPIRAELTPLLAQLHAGAVFDLDPDKMLVRSITRDGVTDPLDVLSGGAYEQIAILTRLAFARLFAKQGQHVPIILDDALVHTDDARIEAMFTMLAQTAQNQQIIVLSCRTRAFSELGGTRAAIRVGTD